MKRNVEINGTSPMNDILGALTGPWSSSTINEWKVTWLSSKCCIWSRWTKKGGCLLPKKAEKTLMCKVFNIDGSVGCKFIKIGESSIAFDKECYAEILILEDDENE